MDVNSVSGPDSVRDLSGPSSENRNVRSSRSRRRVHQPKNRLREDKLDQDISERMEERLEEEIDRLNEIVRTYDRKLNFQLHRETESYFVEVIDVVEDEVIREVPPEEILDLVARIDDMIGLIIDERR